VTDTFAVRRTETFVDWQPDAGIPRRLEVVSLQDDGDGLVLVLADEATRRPSVKLIFEDFVAYRNVNESFRLRTWGAHDMRSYSSLLIVEGSLWLEWLREESGGMLLGAHPTDRDVRRMAVEAPDL
jgi:hypothetical protein